MECFKSTFENLHTKKAMAVSGINKCFYSEYLASSVGNETSAVVAILYVKNYNKISKIFKSTFLDKSPHKLDLFALNIQSM